MSKFVFRETSLAGLYEIEPTVFGDIRGYFMESYNEAEFHAAGLTMRFVQDNESASSQNVLRGLHFQKKNPQGKLVHVIEGAVFDVAADLRRSVSGRENPGFGKWHGCVLSGDNKKQMYIPEGFAHGFLVLSERAVFSYKCTRLYDPADEGGILWNDPDIAVNWPDCEGLILSQKDTKAPTLRELGFFYDL